MTDLPQRIGPFRILEVLGEGGMGRVYLAEQDEPARRVALKVLRTAALGGEALARFRRESELLAELEHPNIARLYASGTAETSTGAVPWLALELVRGKDLVRHAEAAGLDLKARLALLATVCRAVHHAHSRGVIHRDLKPANVLVDEFGVPKILDFGVARVADAGQTMTQAGEVLGTIPYMSPEQLEGSAHRVDPRGDVYSLGVIAYQLLSGQLPFPGLDTDTIISALAKLRGGDPVALGKVAPAARGDAETIIMKALATDPARRYQSAVEFAADLERFVDDQPIEARPPTVRYVLSVFVRRHRGLATGAGLSLLAILVSAGFAVNSAISEARARQEAESRAAELAAVNAFLQDMFKSADPERTRGRNLTVREVLDVARNTLDADASMPAEVANALRHTLGVTYKNLGEPDAALPLLETAEQAAKARGDAALADQLFVERMSALMEKGDYAPTEAELRTWLERPAPPGGEPLRVRLVGEQTLGQVIALQGRTEEALPILRDVYVRMGAAFGATDRMTTSIGSDIASVLREANQLDEAAKLGEEVWKNRAATLGEDHPDTLLSYNLLGAIVSTQGDKARAETMFREAAAGRERVLGPEHIETLASLQNLAVVLVEQQKQAEALPIIERVVTGTVKYFGPEHTRSLRIQNILAYALEDLGRLEEAEAQYRSILAVQSKAKGREHPENFAHYNNLAMLLMKRGGLAESRRLFEDLLRNVQAAVGTEHPYYGIFQSNYGECLSQSRQYPAARRALEQAVNTLAAKLGETHPRTKVARERLLTVYRAVGANAEAKALEAKLANG